MAFNDLFLRACRGERVERVPVWYMRQAGRYQPEYRAIKEKYSLMEICEQPELCAQVTLLPIAQLGVDAAILFSDITIPLKPMGVDVYIKGGYGPVIENPIRTLADVERLRPVDAHTQLPATMETIRILNRELSVPLIGFAGAPFTLASYMIEGGPSREYRNTKAMMYKEPAVWSALMDHLSSMIIEYMTAQAAAGASAIQIFDSWIGSLSPRDFADFVFPWMKRIFDGLRETKVPTIYFGTHTGELLSQWASLDADIIGLDWRVSISEGRKRVGPRFGIQGNLDPSLLLAPTDLLHARTADILDDGMQDSRYIFNLGHGIFPEASVSVLQRLTEYVHAYSDERIASGGVPVRG